jgi:hypothetical protein
VPECDGEASIMNWPWATMGCCEMELKKWDRIFKCYRNTRKGVYVKRGEAENVEQLINPSISLLKFN